MNSSTFSGPLGNFNPSIIQGSFNRQMGSHRLRESFGKTTSLGGGKQGTETLDSNEINDGIEYGEGGVGYKQKRSPKNGKF